MLMNVSWILKCLNLTMHETMENCNFRSLLNTFDNFWKFRWTFDGFSNVWIWLCLNNGMLQLQITFENVWKRLKVFLWTCNGFSKLWIKSFENPTTVHQQVSQVSKIYNMNSVVPNTGENNFQMFLKLQHEFGCG